MYDGEKVGYTLGREKPRCCVEPIAYENTVQFLRQPSSSLSFPSSEHRN